MKYFWPVIFLGILMFGMASEADAQRKKVMNLPKYDLEPYHFGFILAANQMHYSLKLKEGFQYVVHPIDTWENAPSSSGEYRVFNITQIPQPGFTIGIVGNLRISNNFDLRFIPSVSIGDVFLKYDVYTPDDGLVDFESKYKSYGVDFPLLIKYRSKRLNNAAAYLIAGFNPRLELSERENINKEEIAPGTIVSITRGISFKTSDLLYEVGVGFDFYTTFFKFGVELKMSYGLIDQLIDNGSIHTNSIESLHNKIFQLSFTFE